VHTDRRLWIGAQVIIGIGRGCGFQMPLLAIQSSFAPHEATIGTSLVIFCQYLGGAIFSSVGETIFISSLVESMSKYAPQVNVHQIIDAGAASARNSVTNADLAGVLLAYNQALSNVFVSHCFPKACSSLSANKNRHANLPSQYLATAVAISSFVACWGMGWKGLKKHN
jgi:hypothetical protein